MGHEVLLINPAINPRTQRKVVTSIIRASFPFSLGHLAGYLLAHTDSSPRIRDEQLDPLGEEELERTLAEMAEPRLLGISTLTATSARAYELTRRIKAIDPEAMVVLGGVHPTVLPEEGLAAGADLVVRGEGEETLAEITAAVREGRDWRGIAGTSHRADGRPVHNPDRPLIADLDSLPPFPYHLFAGNLHRYPGFASVQTSRGCPYGCTFCSQRSITGRSYRYVSTGRALAEIELLVERYGARLIRIMDDNLAANKRRLLELLEGLVARGLHERTAFEAPMRGDNIDAEILAALEEANFTLVTFGLETASERLMEEINKGESVADVVRAIEMTAAAGISVGTTVIFGLPGETRRDRRNAVRLVKRLPLDSVRFNTLTPYPGTPVYDRLKEEGKVHVKEGWENFSVQYMWEGDELPYTPDGTSRYELMFATMWANLWFYLRPQGLKKIFTKSAAGGNVISLKRRWYFSSFLFRLARVGFYLTSRFALVGVKMVGHRALGR